MRLVFFGTPAFAVPTLDALSREHEIALVVAQPDKPVGRGMKLQSPAVVLRARELGLPVAQPAKIRTAEFLDSIAALKPDAAIVIAYGRILPGALLQVPAHGFLNVHASVLPKYRGAAPIQRAIERGETETGVTIMRVDEELDHGAILAIERTPIGADEHTPSLSARLASLGGEALLRVLRDIPPGQEQDHAAATFAPKIEKDEGLVRWDEPAKAIYDKFRAFDPWPGIFTTSMKLIDVAPAEGGGEPGRVLAIDDGVVVACGEGALRVRKMQRPGKAAVDAAGVARAERWRAAP